MYTLFIYHINNAQDGLHKLMKRLPIVSTRICLYWKEVKVNGVFRRDPNRHGTHQSVIPPIEANLKQLNVKGVAQNLIVAAPSLRRINLAVSGQDETFWKVTSDKLLVQYLNFNGWEGDEQEPLPSIPIL